MKQEKTTSLLHISRVVSDVFNPIFSLLIFFGFFAYTKMNFTEAWQNSLLIIFVVVIPIFSWIYYNVKKGKYTNMDVSNREQRKTLYIFNFFVILTYIAILYFTKQRTDLLIIIIFLFFLILIMQLSNFYIKSSIHTSVNIFVSALFFSIKPLYGLLWFLLAILIGITRIVLKRHTLKEVFMGGFIALIISFLYLYFQINV